MADTFPRGWGWCPSNIPPPRAKPARWGITSGGKDTLLGISKRGNAYLRTLYIHGARAVLRTAATKEDRFSRWANALHARRGHNRACVAVANKLARIAWVILAKGESYRPAV